MPQTRRIRAYQIGADLLPELLTGKAEIVPFQEGVEVVRFGYQWETNSAILFLSHESWDEVPQGETVPLTRLFLRRKS